MTGSFMGRGNQYIQLKVLYCKLPSIVKETINFSTYGLGFEPLSSVGGVLPLDHRGPETVLIIIHTVLLLQLIMVQFGLDSIKGTLTVHPKILCSSTWLQPQLGSHLRS